MIGIEAIGSYLPSLEESNYSRLKKFNVEKEFIENKTGFRYLRKALEEEKTSDLCLRAFEDLDSIIKINLSQIDCCIVVTQNPDFKIPHVSSIVHKNLNLSENCACFDISLGCSGYVYGLSIIKSFMNENDLSKGLLFTSDPYSKIIDESDKGTSLLFGDGATVTLIGKEFKFGFQKFNFGTKGKSFSDLMCEKQLKMNGRGVYNFAAKRVPKDILDILKKNSLSIDEIDLFVLHQGSKFIIDTIREELKLSEGKMGFYAANYGNLVSSSIPFILKDQIKENHQKILISGFGVGLSWSSTILIRNN